MGIFFGLFGENRKPGPCMEKNTGTRLPDQNKSTTNLSAGIKLKQDYNNSQIFLQLFWNFSPPAACRPASGILFGIKLPPKLTHGRTPRRNIRRMPMLYFVLFPRHLIPAFLQPGTTSRQPLRHFA
jgi:hypothetical protein